MTALEYMLDDSDWREAIGEAGLSATDIAGVIAEDAGSNDGDNWIAIFYMNDGKFAFISASCDYTGWDCQSWGQSDYANTLEELVLMGIGIGDISRLGKMFVTMRANLEKKHGKPNINDIC